MRYVRAGHGPTLVLIHGYGESLMSWRAVFDLLAPRADVIAIDLPGFGLSSKPATGYATDSLAADVLRALDALGVRRAVVAGHSLGGAVAVAAALMDTARIQGLVLIDAAVVGTPAAVSESRDSSRTGSATGTAITEYEAVRTRFAAPHDPHWLAESDSAALYVPADDPRYRGALAAVLREFDFAYLTADRAARLTLPTLIVWGEYDEVFPLAAGQALAAALPGSRLKVVSRAWHRPHVERPAETADAIARFVTGR